MTASRDAALDYGARGWPLFPVNPATNAPWTRHGFKDATTDRAQIERWWTARPDAAIGVRTGVVFDVLDVDHEDFDEGVGDLTEQQVEVFGWRARSGGGGWHIYFLPTGIGRRIRFSRHCDWLGADGYVIVPPSGHKSGGRYRWIVSPDELELHDPPARLVVSVLAAKPPATQTVDTPSPSKWLNRHSSGCARWSATGIIGKMATAVEGERNAVLWWAARRIGLDVYDHKVDEATALIALDQLAGVAENTGLGRHEVDGTIKSGYQTGRSGIRDRVGGAR